MQMLIVEVSNMHLVSPPRIKSAAFACISYGVLKATSRLHEGGRTTGVDDVESVVE